MVGPGGGAGAAPGVTAGVGLIMYLAYGEENPL